MSPLSLSQEVPRVTLALFKVLEFEIQSTIQANGLAFHNLKELIPISPAMAAQSPMLGLQVEQGGGEAMEKIQKETGQIR